MNTELHLIDGALNWDFNGTAYCYKAEGVQSAREKNGRILMDIYSDGDFYYRFIDLCGKDILSYNDYGELTVYGSEKNTELSFDKINDVAFKNENILVMLDNEIVFLSGNGTVDSRLLPPYGYSFYRFAGDEGISVICNGNSQTADKFGRNDWKFTYDVITGNWSDGKVAY